MTQILNPRVNYNSMSTVRSPIEPIYSFSLIRQIEDVLINVSTGAFRGEAMRRKSISSRSEWRKAINGMIIAINDKHRR